MVEWTKAPHWKCGVGQLTEGSNPSLSAIFFAKKMAERRRKLYSPTTFKQLSSAEMRWNKVEGWFTQKEEFRIAAAG